MGLLVGAMDIATANNTVAIVMANPIAKEMARDVRHLQPQDGIHTGHVLVRVPGHHPVWRPDARRHIGGNRAGVCRVGLPDHPVSVLSLPAFGKLPRVHLPGSREEAGSEGIAAQRPRTTGSGDGNRSPPLPVVRGPEPPATPAYADPRLPCRRPAPAMTLSLTRLRKSLFRAGGAPVILRQPHLLRLCRAVVVDHAVEQRADLVRVVRLAERPTWSSPPAPRWSCRRP